MFLKQLAIKLLKYLGINKHIINLEKSKQILYKSIYSLELIELETIKINIKINIDNYSIQLFKFPTKVVILFYIKSDSSLYLFTNY